MLHYVLPISIAAGVLVLVGLVRWIAIRRLDKAHLTATDLDDFLLDLARRTKILLLILPAIFLGARALEVPREIARLVRAGAGISFISQFALWASGVIDFWLRRYHKHRFENDPAAAMTVNLFRISGVAAVWTVAAIVAIDNLGFNVTTLIAGLGIGGVAVALATQNILGDLFASLSIVVDKPFVIGDSIAVGDDSGVVEHIGLKTTRLRGSQGEELILSNGDLLKSRIHNFKRMHERRAITRIVVIPETSAEKLAQIPILLRAAIEKQPDAKFGRVHFVIIGEIGHELEMVFSVASGDYTKFLDVQQAILLEIARTLQDAGVSFAFPSPRPRGEG